MGLVDLFLPFFPLERSHIRQLLGMRLGERAEELAARRLGALHWDEGVIDFLIEKARDSSGRRPPCCCPAPAAAACPWRRLGRSWSGPPAAPPAPRAGGL